MISRILSSRSNTPSILTRRPHASSSRCSSEVTKAEELKKESPTAVKPVIGICFESDLDAEAYALKIVSDRRFNAVVIHHGVAVEEPLDLLLTDRCLKKSLSSDSSDETIESVVNDSFIGTETIRIARKPNVECRCCPTVSNASDWASLLKLIEKILVSSESVEDSVKGKKEKPQKISYAARRGLPAELDCLTRREIDILQLVGMGHSVKEMSEQLRLAESTVGNHKYRLMQKLDVKTSLGLLRIAVRCGLAEL